MNTSSDQAWMRAALNAAFELPNECVVDALKSDDAFDLLRLKLEAQLAARPEPVEIEPGERGDNLLKALLALRIKFPQTEANAKLELNIAMRTRR
jgi:hypothetical protein